MNVVDLTGDSLQIDEVVAVAHQETSVAPLSPTVKERMQASQTWVEETVQTGQTVIYGVNTGFGPLATTQIDPDETRRLSRNIILNCACGVGPPLPKEVVRAMMVIRANTLAKGVSGVRIELVETLIEMLNQGVTPIVPSKGSLGASGDLAPLAHIALVMTRGQDGSESESSGSAWFQGQALPGSEAMAQAGIPRLIPQAKEGLALTNGTTMMVAAGVMGLSQAFNLLQHAEIAAGMSMEALLGLSQAYHPALHNSNGQPGQIRTASNLRALLAHSQLIDSDPERVQDAYCLRCTPQVLGPARDLLDFLKTRFTQAINAATDNPLIFEQGDGSGGRRAVSGGNFHGAGPAMWLDFLSIAMAEVGSISERRVFRMLTPELNAGLPAMLVPTSGLDSGLMVPQYTAAALVSDNKTLAHPDSVDSIPSSANQEDHVSMGANAARHCLEILENLHHILAIEFLTAAQAIDQRPDGPARLAPAIAAAYGRIRARVPTLEHDRVLAGDIASLVTMIRSRSLVTEVQEAAGASYEP